MRSDPLYDIMVRLKALDVYEFNSKMPGKRISPFIRDLFHDAVGRYSQDDRTLELQQKELEALRAEHHARAVQLCALESVVAQRLKEREQNARTALEEQQKRARDAQCCIMCGELLGRDEAHTLVKCGPHQGRKICKRQGMRCFAEAYNDPNKREEWFGVKGNMKETGSGEDNAN